MGNGVDAMRRNILFSDLPKLCKGKISGADTPSAVLSLSLDSRKVFPGEGAVYFAIKGPNHDGHSFLWEAYQKGWRLFVVESLPKDTERFESASFFLTSDSLQTLQDLAAAHRSQFSLPVVAITGSNGKTIVKEYLYQLLASSVSVVKSPKSWNSQVGVPLSVWPLAEHHEAGIFEAGISQPDEMAHLKNIIQPTIGIISNIGPAHDALFTSREQKLVEKMKLFEGCKKLIYCTDHFAIDRFLSGNVLPGVARIGWGQGKGAKYAVSTVGSKLKLAWEMGEVEIDLPFTDDKSVENLCHAVVTALEMGINPSSLARQVSVLSAIPMRLSLKEGVFGSRLVDDSYNNDFQGLEAALDLAITHSHGKPISVVLSDILQAGENEKELYQHVNDMLMSKGVSKLVAIGPTIFAYGDAFRMACETYVSTEAFLEQVKEKQFAGQTVLIKGARSFRFEEIVKKLQAKVHRTVLEVNLEALQHNFQFYKSILEPRVKTMVMLKAFAYGSGSGEIGRTLQYLKADYVAVAYPDEGVLLREQGVHLPVMVMNAPEESFDKLPAYSLEPEIFSLSQLQNYGEWSLGKSGVPPIHIKVDTGMHRLGFVADEIEAIAEVLDRYPNIKVASIFSHLAGSENSAFDDFTHVQAKTFLDCYEQLSQHLGYKPIRHLVNTAGISRFKSYQFDMVRVGIGLHGIESTEEKQGQLTVVARLKTVVSQVRRLAAGQTVGYSRAGKTNKDTDVATIAIGYADGYPRSLGNGKGKVLIKEQLLPTIGSVCMDMTMVDVTGVDVREGDEVVVFGEHPSANQVAEWAGTIPYEILTSVSERVKREYLSF
ncbi:MAG: bifunctional UDP-N-acetylmuramoyl-tripeptide:D-alanyl-D-alanine ligase/alanine racemase [Imperialibacter sp.]|uniref:bifunctional UDP-N-acetylmuramoyl-tripeptide:D-alanyl-D-alanine ligase/alanine racemase n=1 Tax=Imperialibacter sp. TaxID=2038411 RepID=UPI003A8928CA